MKVLNYLDCGCAILENGVRSWCPSCNANPIESAAQTTTTVCENCQAREARLERAEHLLQQSEGWLENSLEIANYNKASEKRVMELIADIRNLRTEVNSAR